MKTVASRVAFPSALEGFDPAPFLTEEFRRAYEHPDSLLSTPLPVPKAYPCTTARTELWQLMWRWDQVHRLTLAL